MKETKREEEDMRILPTITMRNIKLGKKRAIATIVAIILSTALITATFGLITSFQRSLLKDAEKEYGTYHVLVKGVNAENTKYLENNREIASITRVYTAGYAQIEESKNDNKPYIYVQALDAENIKEYGVHLTAGRFPKSEEEILIPEHLKSNGMVEWKLGDTITVQIGDRTSEGYILSQNTPYMGEEETIEHMQEKTYRIVGKMERLNYNVEPYSAPGYTCIIGVGNQPLTTWNGLVTFQDVQKVYDQMDAIEGNFDGMIANSEVLRYSGVLRNDATQVMLYSVASIVAAIIVFTSVFVIRNSFSIMVAEKNKQYGMLASIGATKKQIKKTVLLEGAFLGAVGIPLGILGGMFAVYCLVEVVNYILTNFTGANMQFYFYFPTLPVIAGGILAILTIYLSCLMPAKRAAKISPIDAIRGRYDTKRMRKKLKAPKWVHALFGIGGTISYKNLKRSKKQYRTTVISLVVSICVFISLSSFTGYVLGLKDSHYEESGYDVYAYANMIEDTKQKEAVYEKIANLEGVDKAFIAKRIMLKAVSIGAGEDTILLNAIRDEDYKELCKKLGVDSKKEGAIVNAFYYFTNEQGKVEKRQTYPLKKGDTLQAIQEEKTGDIAYTIPILQTLDENYAETGSAKGFIVSESYLKKLVGEHYQITGVYIQTQNPDRVVEQINQMREDMHVVNYYEQEQEAKAITWIVNIFLYGFIFVITLIGVTNIFNTITTNMVLRSREFAMLKSIGMTQKEFHRMIRLESVFYGTKSLVIGILLGLGLSYAIYYAFTQGMEITFECPWGSILMAILFVFIIIFITMTYSLRKIGKQNIIETIRKDAE